MADEARRQAREADRELASGHDRGPLHGVPISIKDLFDIRGVPTTAASRVREGHVAQTRRDAIAHLRQAGAVFVGKTNLHEFAFGTTNEDSAFGPARNPHDPSRSPGGSSGGSAVSVATGMALATVGSDTGGSIRIPAAACGIVGLKPSFGDVVARGGKIILMTDAKGAAEATIESLVTIVLPDMPAAFTPMVYAVPVQLLAYHTAVVMGTDVDQPRNLAKSVTVE